jgi:hypothetical protein
MLYGGESGVVFAIPVLALTTVQNCVFFRMTGGPVKGVDGLAGGRRRVNAPVHDLAAMSVAQCSVLARGLLFSGAPALTNGSPSGSRSKKK